jgi:hypothetical protein
VTRFTELELSNVGKRHEFKGYCGRKLELKSECPGITSTSTWEANFARNPSKVSKTSDIVL